MAIVPPPTPYYQESGITVHHQPEDGFSVLASLPDASVDAVVTDPPYGLEFMGKGWDGADGFRRALNANDAGRDNAFGRTSKTSPEYKTGRGARVLTERAAELTERGKGHSTSAGPYLASGVDSVRVAGRPFQEWCEVWSRECLRVLKPGGHMLAFGGARTFHRLTCAVEDAGFEIRDSIAWLYGSGFPKSLNLVDDEGERTGWGTALKPAHEPIVVARKPLAGTVAANVLAHGTGALNIDGCRIGREEGDRTEYGRGRHLPHANTTASLGMFAEVTPYEPHGAGRWPANVVLDESQAAALDEQTGESQSRIGKPRRADNGDGWGMTATGAEYDDHGGASRFLYVAKAGADERVRVDGIAHPTVKPLSLMRWLVRLVTPPGGTVLEPFAGSGTTVEACILEGFNCTAIERDDTYLPLIRQRINRRRNPVEAVKAAGEDGGLFDLLEEGA